MALHVPWESGEFGGLTEGIYLPFSSLPPLVLSGITTGKDSSREATERDKVGGGGEWNKMDYEFENCQLSCIIQSRAPAQ